MKPAIFVTRKLPPAAMALLEENFQMECNPHNRVLSREELLDAVRGKEGILSLLTDAMDGEVMDSAGKSLKMIANYAVGFNNIDVDAATKRMIAVSNTPGVLTDTTAETHPDHPGGFFRTDPWCTSGFSNSASVGSSCCIPRRAPGAPTLLIPVRITLWPVINAERPAVQLCSA